MLRIQGKTCAVKSTGGWLDGLSDSILECKDVELACCFLSSEYKHIEQGKNDNFSYYIIPATGREIMDSSNAEVSYELNLKKIVQSFNPDVIHVFGTELKSAYILVRICEKIQMLDRVVISIQGLTSIFGRHYFEGIEYKERSIFTVQELLHGTSMIKDKLSYVKRGALEIKTIESVNHIIGRTDWDYACVKAINPKVTYHFCNETLRKEFYTGDWSYAACKKHSIYVSQASYPVKGFHMLLMALPVIIKEYPDVMVMVAGNNRYGSNLIKGSGYYIYLQSLIKKLKLKNHIRFLGPLDAVQVKEHMLAANVVISPSNIENSPNSLGEAMLLGVPCISSDVGGVKNLMRHEEEGYIYPSTEYYMIPYYVSKVFDNEEQAEFMGEKAKMHARRTHDREINNRRLIEIYEDIIHCAKE